MPLDAEHRTAVAIAMVLHQTLDATLHQLRTLEAEGQAQSQTDKAGVMRWSLVAEESGAAMELGAEVWMAGHYEPTPKQMGSLGLS